MKQAILTITLISLSISASAQKIEKTLFEIDTGKYITLFSIPTEFSTFDGKEPIIMKTIKKYKDGWEIRLSSKNKYYLFKDGEMILCDNLKDCRFMHWSLKN